MSLFISDLIKGGSKQIKSFYVLSLWRVRAGDSGEAGSMTPLVAEDDPSPCSSALIYEIEGQLIEELRETQKYRAQSKEGEINYSELSCPRNPSYSERISAETDTETLRRWVENIRAFISKGKIQNFTSNLGPQHLLFMVFHDQYWKLTENWLNVRNHILDTPVLHEAVDARWLLSFASYALLGPPHGTGQKGEGCKGDLVIHTSGRINGGPTEPSFHERWRVTEFLSRVLAHTQGDHHHTAPHISAQWNLAGGWHYTAKTCKQAASHEQSVTALPTRELAPEVEQSQFSLQDLRMNAGLGHLVGMIRMRETTRTILGIRSEKLAAPTTRGRKLVEYKTYLQALPYFDRSEGDRERARGTCCPPFLLCFENLVNGELAEEKEKGKAEASNGEERRSARKEWEIVKDDFFVGRMKG
ncbi:hypothetical protein HAX54_040974 [Datura stramonium]|uniref:Uncharacterized protein n=1 Tax=Datura stramonium TaxID=4076 RepID=A0ABS8VTC4_DATST|nr:hypothetical protein [Datura stramonium]